MASAPHGSRGSPIQDDLVPNDPARSAPVRADLRVDALIRQPEALHRPSAHQVLLHKLCGVCRLHVAIPDSFGIHHHRWSMFALVEAAGFVDAHGRAESSRF